MNYANYAAFRTSVQTMLDGDDISTSDLSVTTLDLIIGMGEQRIYREMRSSTQDAALSINIVANTATLPSDFLELRGSAYLTDSIPAIYMPWEAVRAAIQVGSGSTSPVFYTFEGDTIIFYPMQETGVTISGRYYKRFADISTGLNALFTRHPDIFLYASLAEGGTFMGEQTRTPGWEAKYVSLVQAANEQERRRVTRGSKLQTRIT